MEERESKQQKDREMQRKGKLGGKSEDKWWRKEDYFWKYEGRHTERKQLAHGWMVPAGECRGAGITEETLAFSMEPHPMLKMPSGAHSF